MPKPLMLHAEMRYGQWCSDALILVLPGRLAKSTGSAHKFASILEKRCLSKVFGITCAARGPQVQVWYLKLRRLSSVRFYWGRK